MNLSVLEMEVGGSSPELAKSVSENVAIVRQISTELRTLSYLLHPPMLDEVGLKSALRWYIDGFAERSSIKVTLELSDDLGRLPREMEIALFRVIQECLTNIHRHSGTAKANYSASLGGWRSNLGGERRRKGHNTRSVVEDYFVHRSRSRASEECKSGSRIWAASWGSHPMLGNRN